MPTRRVAIVGASGNVGTALLRHLVADPEFSDVLGISRRTPHGPPYESADWREIDIAAAGGAQVVESIAQAVSGYDAIVHLVWAIQPNTRRDVIRQTNVEGTRRVLEAAALAGVPHVVVASSVAAYSPSPGPELRDESHPTHGIRTSHYSVDKAAQERLLAEFGLAHPELSVASMRTSLVFQADAGAEVARLFVGPLAPLGPLLSGRLPVVSLPRGLRLQATHADDVASAYAAVLRAGASGPFNVAAEPLLDGHDLAGMLGSGRLLELPSSAIRPLLHLAWRARLVAADPGWLDMAMNAPVMDTTRIRELGWRETRSAREATLDVIAGMRSRIGTGSPVLRAGDRMLDDGDLRRR